MDITVEAIVLLIVALAVIILLGILYLIGEFSRRTRLIGQFILNVCIILCLLVCISRGIPIII